MYRKLLERGWFAIILAFVLAGSWLGSYLPGLTVDAATNMLLDEKDPDLRYYAQSRRLWPSDDEFAIVCCHREAGWFTTDALALLRSVEKDLAAVPHVRKVVDVFTIPLLRQTALPLPMVLDANGVELARAREELTHHTLAKGTLISEDGKDAVLLAYLDQPPDYARLDRERDAAMEAQNDARVAAIEPAYEVARKELRERRIAMVKGVRGAAERWTPRMDGPIRLSGLPIINVNLIEHVSDDIRWFGIASLLLFTLGFAVVYRKLRFTVVPIVTCVLPVVLILGAMAFLGQRLTVITANLPLLLFVVMLPYTVYLVERYRERRAIAPHESHAESTTGAAQDIWLPCFYSCITTMAGFASLMTSGVKPVWWFGLMMTVGLAVGLVCTFLFMPAATVKLRALNNPDAAAQGEPAGIVRLAERLVLSRPLLVVLVAAAVFGAGVWGMSRLTAENKFIDYFRPTSEVYTGLEYIDTRMGGTTPLDIVLSSKEPGFFKTPKGIEAIRSASAHIETVPEVGSVTSLATLIDEARKAPAFAKAQDRNIIAIGEANKDLKSLILDVATPDYATARVLVRFRETAPTLHRRAILDGLNADLAQRAELTELSPRVTGVFLLYSNMLESLIATKDKTSTTVTLWIFTMLVLLLGGFALVTQFFPKPLRTLLQGYAENERPTLGSALHAVLLAVIVIVPQALPAVVVLGVMGWTGVPLDLITVTIAAIAMGVGDDSAIQYTVRYRMELAATGGDRRAAVTRTHASIGRAIWIATTIMVVGFGVMVLSKFVPTITFGVFTALAMLMGQFATLTVLPSLFMLTGLPRYKPPAAN